MTDELNKTLKEIQALLASQMSRAQEWWELPGADENRPMNAGEAARFLGIGPPNYPNPERTVLRWAQDGQIKKVHRGIEPCFTLAILREYMNRELASRRK